MITEKTNAALRINRTGKHGKSSGDHRDACLVCPSFDEKFVQSGFGRREKKAIWFVKNPFFGTKNPNQLVHLIVVGFQVLVAYRPIVTHPIDASTLEVIRSKTKRDSPPVVGTTTHHSGAKPVKLRSILARVGFALNFPSSDSLIKISKGTDFGARTSSWGLPRWAKLGSVFFFGGIEISTGFHHGNGKACFGKNFGGHASASSRTNNDDVVTILGFFDL